MKILLGAVAVLALTPGLALAGERLCEGYGGLPEGAGPTAGMVAVPGGSFTMGDDGQRPEERTAHRVTLSPFWIDRHEVTNAQFRRFVDATGYRTMAERGLSAADHPGMPPELLAPGAVVFEAPQGLVDLVDPRRCWRYVAGADWRHPSGPGSSVDGGANRPVVDVAHEDALAYGRWLGHELPTEARWEFAARGGLDAATYGWGEDYHDPAAGWRANTWQGVFPLKDNADDGHHGVAPVGCFPANGYGLFDAIGNVWEYTGDRWAPGHPPGAAADPQGPPAALAASYGGGGGPSAVIKGGSFLCAPNFCARYRPSARQPQELGLGASHLGFRTVLARPAPPVGREAGATAPGADRPASGSPG